ncbi:small multi-drug export protein [Sphingomonas sp. A2-49]|uniref:small multi-drug export protein n=1 Tax=Sphingomonas sp. A2-49 TaxID=1391375 RepID=UPI0021D01A79|nr:small multi-drug export protein [Sphingomonas sp. A2-49]MCU6455240.1 small multi-drug export protein [Sphingomonas sp. A2-49]
MSKIEEVQATVRNTPGLGKKMAKYGAIGAVVAIPIPFVGPVLGALVGAGVAYAKRKD